MGGRVRDGSARVETMSTEHELLAAVLALSVEKRERIMDEIAASLSGEAPEVTEEMAEELASRFARMDGGERVAAEDVLRRPSPR